MSKRNSASDLGAMDDHAFERLSSYLDGALSDADRRAVEADLSANPAMRRVLSEMRALESDLQAAFPIAETAPRATSVDTAAARSRPRPTPRNSVAARAWRRPSRFVTAALAVGFGVGSLRLGETVAGGVAVGPVATSSTLETLLEHAAIGDEAATPDGAFVVLGTFLKPGGAPCREFEKLSDAETLLSFGLACRTEGAAWRVMFAATAPKQETPDGRITPASGPSVDAMDRLLDRLDVGPMLSADEEARLIAAGWR